MSAPSSVETPSVGHLVWFGGDFPYTHALALRSASRVGRLERVVLHHDRDLSQNPYWGEVASLPGFEPRLLDAEAMLEAIPKLGATLVDVYRGVEQPAARANLIRLAALWAEGGVYLDLDTLTVADLAGLRSRGDFFCGEEPIAYPAALLESRAPHRWATALALDALRDVCRRLPNGWRTFRRFEPLYARGANNAVIGAPAAHPFVEQLLEAAVAVPTERRTIRYELGTSLLQRALQTSPPNVTVYPPDYFYPLGPEISQHWFRATSGPPRTDAVLTARTHVIHWYASVRTRDVVPRIDPAWIGTHRDRELFSAVVSNLPI